MKDLLEKKDLLLKEISKKPVYITAKDPIDDMAVNFKCEKYYFVLLTIITCRLFLKYYGYKKDGSLSCHAMRIYLFIKTLLKTTESQLLLGLFFHLSIKFPIYQR